MNCSQCSYPLNEATISQNRRTMASDFADPSEVWCFTCHKVLEKFEGIRGMLPLQDILALEGRKLFNQGYTPEAFNKFKQVLNVDPYHPVAIVGMADIFMMRESYTTAIRYYQTALTHNNQDVSILCNLAVIHSKKKDHVKALNLINQAIDITPWDPELLFNKGLILQYQKRWDEALAIFDKVIQEHSPADQAASLLHKGIVLGQLGRLEESQECTLKILQLGQSIKIPHEIRTMAAKNMQEINLALSREELMEKVDDSYSHQCPECKGPMQLIMRNCPSCGLRVKEEGSVLYPDLEMMRNQIFGSISEVWIYEINSTIRRAIATFTTSEYTVENPDTVLYLNKRLYEESKDPL